MESLKLKGYRVLDAGDGREALRLAQGAGDIDLLITDVVMPGMNGRELAEAARTAQPTLRVLYTSGYTDDAVVRHGVHHDRVAFLEKPYDMHRLAGKVRQILDTSRP
jgi:two-component system, cell cycle sensor histidine kinase and response regulator CckA